MSTQIVRANSIRLKKIPAVYGFLWWMAMERARQIAGEHAAPMGMEFLNSLTDEAESNLLKHIFQNLAWANVGDVSGLQPSSTAGSIYVSLHTADPGETGDQTTSEANYTSYARVAVARSSGGWTVSGTAPTQVANAAAVTWPACTGGSSTVTYFGVGSALTLAGHLYGSAALTSPSSLAISNGITPSAAIGGIVITAD